MTSRKTLALALALAMGLPGLRAQVPEDCYRIETIKTPKEMAPEVSAVAFSRQGRLYASLRRGTIWSMDPPQRQWSPFASGLFWPLGILAGEEGELFVAQIPELTRVVDTDGDGRADLYETICDSWGLSGNYHEFVAGPVRDGEGNFYVSLGCASSGGAMHPPFRGEPSPKRRTGKLYGHHSPVPYRGWIVKISPDGDMTPLASGFRQANGLVFNPQGDLFAVDNQGDWVGTSPLHHVTAGAFHGHPASLVWDPDFEGSPFDVPVEVLKARRKLPAVQFPQNDLAGSVAQPLFDTTQGKFGPYAGQLFVAEWSHPRLHRVSLEKVAGEYQGACFPFFEGRGLRRGSNRIAFAPDGSLWLAQVSKLWGGTGEGLQRIVWTGKTPLDIRSMHLMRDGFELTFTRPVEAKSAGKPGAYSLQSYYYLYHSTYGSPKQGQTPVRVNAARVSKDGLTVRLQVDSLVPGRVYDLRPRGIVGRDGTALVTRMAAYTLNRLRE